MAEVMLVGTPAIRVVLKRSSRAKRLILRVQPNGTDPTLTLPERLPGHAAQAFLSRSEPWLRQRLATATPSVQVTDGTVLPLAGKTLRIEHVTAGRMQLQDGVLLVPGRVEQIPVRAAAFLREQARQAVVTHSDHFARILGKKIGRITLRDPRSRWGSCTSAGDLMYSWRLIMAPPEILRYVAAHETAHLTELNHSARFWSVVERLCPNFAPQRKWLQENGAGLHRFSFTASGTPSDRDRATS